MLVDGLRFMIIGMITVFSFLILMVLVMKGTHALLKVLNRFFPEVQEETMTAKAVEKNDEIAVAIAAVKAFQKK